MRWRPRLPGRATRRHPRRRTAQALAITLVAGVLTVLAINHDGSPINDVDLNDGGVWVSNQNLQMMGRLNSQVKELDMGILTSSTSDDIFQQGASVQVYDDGGGNAERALRLADPVTGTAEPVDLPESFLARAGGGTVAITDRETGSVWVRRADQLDSFTENTPPDFEVAPRGQLVVTERGTALVADRPAGTVTAYRLDVSGVPLEEDVHDFGTEFTDDVALTAVGEVPVALQEGTLLRAGEEPVPVAGDGAVLQQVGPASSTVQVATDEALWQGELSGGGLEERTAVPAGGPAAAPAVVAGCVHAAWLAPGEDNYQRQCGDDEPFTDRIEPLSRDGELVFRSNRDVVVINDVATGGAWLVEQNGLTLVDNWPSVNPNARDPQVAEASDEKSSSKRNKPPQAVDDTFGGRPGATVVLPVTLNDIDPDGDVLTLTKAPGSTRQASFSITGGGTQVQARLAPNVEGSVSFTYEISDGRPANPPSEAKVTIQVFGEDVDKKPALIEGQKNELTVASGHEATTNVLPGWIDPEGDSLVLAEASSEGGEVGFRPDGTVDFLDDGTGGGRKTIDFVVRGGEATAEGSVELTVVDPEKARPEVVADRFSGPVGSSILLEPLENDTDPLGGQLTLPRVQVVAGGAASIAKDTERGTATFESDRHGTYYLEYEASSSNGQPSDTEVIRVDVLPRSGNNRPPVATRDVAAVQSDGTVLVDVLANDVDPDGDVMVVQGVRVPPEWQDSVTASLINKRFVRVEVTGDLQDERPEFEYLVSDGESDQVSGQVSVALSDNLKNRRPVAREDVVTVRAGTIVTVPVLDNDEDPDGDSLSVYQQDLFDVDTHTEWVADGTVPIVATGDGIRVKVPDDGTTQMQVGYGVRDREQARADARLVLNIKPDDPDNNRAPEAPPIEDRTVSGQRIRVPVDIFGADPDGDPVVYTGLEEPPRFGRIVRAGAGWFEYEPFEGEKNTGTDQFKVRVSDPYGASGTADVRIGVAARSAVNQAPAALDDRLLVKPGLTIQYPVTQNDSDPDGDPLILEEDEFSAPEGVDARIVDDFVEMKVPALGEQSEVSKGALYSITDGLGTSSSALLTVTARKDAPDHAPLAADDVVTTDQMAGKTAGETVDVDVLANDGDLDGSRDDLELEAVETDGSSIEGRQLQVELRPEARTVPYKITDATGQSSFGFVYVSGTENTPPQLNTAAVPVEVVAGEEETIALEDVVVVRDGRTPKVARTDRITTTNGDTRTEGLTELLFRAPPAYHGPASVTLDVIDGEDLNDPTGLTAQVTIPINVLPASNVAPEVRSTEVVVYAGGEPRTVDLDRLATDVNEDDLDFEVEGARDGVEAGIEDGVLVVSAEDGAPSGELDLEVRASDGDADPQVGTVGVTVIGVDPDEEEDEEEQESAPPMQLVELRVADGVAGEPVTVDTAEAVAFDPYPGQSKTVTFTSTGTASGSTITLTPDGAGEIVVTYRLDDGSGDAAREVQGRVVVVVADVPAAPLPPTAVEGGPDSVQLTWRAPDDQGSPIQHYLVRRVGSGDTTRCVATQCTIEGLDAGAEYRFTVAAVNAIGEGEPSAASGPVTPDTVPGTMVAPVLSESDYEDRNGKLRLSWTKPQNEGSDITSYELESQPATSRKSVGAGQTQVTWQGLQNGTSYRFRVRAVNDRGEGVWSPWSDTQTPFTRPSQMSPPTLEAAGNEDGNGEGYLAVRWAEPQPPANGHDPVTSYEVQVFRDGALYRTKPATATSTDFTVPNGSSYTATVRATNRAGWSDWSGQSAAQITYDQASAPRNITKVNDCDNCGASTSAYRGVVRFQAPADNGGYPVVAYDFRTTDGVTGRWTVGAGETTVQRRVNFTSIGAGKDVTITPVTRPPGRGEIAGAAARGGNFSPYAKPFPPSISWIQGYRMVGATWSCDGNGRPVQDFNAVYTGAQSGQSVNGARCGQRHTESPIEGGDSRCFKSSIRTAGGTSTVNEHGCRRADDPTVDVSFVSGANAPVSDCARPCYNVRVSAAGFLQGSWTMTAQTGSGPGSCGPGNFGGSRKSMGIGSDGRGATTTSWFISGSCSGTRVTVTIQGRHANWSGSRNVP
ncbi:fibronectin type III domain-containing protein [Nocardioides panacisoli]|uniref:fibronectin type III domain-containing protein n=1 Tax=Nocardioides panacisoli TaxID=627624 RepID=UPI001C630F25|nr:fibronectin type III domain-containing protein [Nocardioides panacisoli]QYJ05600.1 fibronectin type III domain-containing protein [Nocardioides panacisoli]